MLVPPLGRFLSVLALGLAACGGAAPRSSSPSAGPRPLSETRALAIVHDVLTSEGRTVADGWTIDLGGQPLVVDARIGGTPFGIEWVSAADRSREGDRLPLPASGDQLRILAGQADGERVQVLVLEAAGYVYDDDPRAARRGEPTAVDVELRLERDLRDFLRYVGSGSAR